LTFTIKPSGVAGQVSAVEQDRGRFFSRQRRATSEKKTQRNPNFTNNAQIKA